MDPATRYNGYTLRRNTMGLTKIFCKNHTHDSHIPRIAHPRSRSYHISRIYDLEASDLFHTSFYRIRLQQCLMLFQE